MAETTVLSMANSILGSAISKASAVVAEEMSLLMGVQKEIWFMKDELQTMRSFIVVAKAMKKKKPLLKVWVEQVRSLSYDIEDCLDEFMVHMGSKSLSKQLMKLKDRHRIAIQIQNLKSRVEEVSNRNTRYNLIDMEDPNIDEAHSTMEDIRNLSASNIDKEKLVGFESPKRVLLDMINTQDNDSHARVICVVGMGGLGKTTLVRKIYESKEEIARKFSCFAWITVSQSFSKIDMLKDMIMQLFGHDSLKNRLNELVGKEVQVEDLASYLREHLRQRRYFIVFDDLWAIADWNWIRNISLPISNNKASQIIVTTRDAQLADDICTVNKSLIYRLEPLKEEHAIGLLLMKVGKRREDMENDENLNTLVKQLVKKCGYLPLAIVTVGGLFAIKHESEWAKIYNHLPSELETNLSLEAIKRMVILSYSYLSSHLKPCFLYLSIFPEDFEIKRKRLVNRWIAEGLVRARVGMTLEDVGESYFNELISRCMILPSRVNLQGIVKSCRVHDIIREIMILLSREDCYVYTSSNNVPNLVEVNYRHVAYQVNKCSAIGMDWGRVRSLTIFGNRPVEHALSHFSTQLRMIRALDLENVHFNVAQKDISNIGLLRHLKYLNISCLADSGIYALPRSIEKLQGLQTLEIRNSYITTLPTKICKVKDLRTLYFSSRLVNDYIQGTRDCLMYSLCLPIISPLLNSKNRHHLIAKLHKAYSSCCSTTIGVTVPRGIGNLNELQTLGVVDIKRTSKKAIRELGELSKLRKLNVTTSGATEKKCMILCEAIQKLSNLGSLRINGGRSGTVEWLDSVSSPPLLRSLTLRGRFGDKVDWFSNLTQLVKLRLEQSELEEGKALGILGALANLMLLELNFQAYSGKKLVFRPGTFLNLRILVIYYLRPVREIRFEKEASPQMERIEIKICKLELGVNGINHLPKLKEIALGKLTHVARLGMLQDEVNAHPNHPVLQLFEDRLYHDLGDLNGADEFFDAGETLPDQDEEGLEATAATTSDSQLNSASN